MDEKGIRLPQRSRFVVGLGALAIAPLIAGCGGASRPAAARRSDSPAHYPVALARVSFPAHQRLAQRSRLVIAVRNAGQRAIPDVSVTIVNPSYGTSVQPFATYLQMTGVESHSRPVWVVDQAPGPCRFSSHATGPGGAVTPEPNTWALGRLPAGATATFSWTLSAVMAGEYRVHYAVTADLGYRPSAVLTSGAPAAGTLDVRIRATPQHETVSDSGAIVRSG